MCVDEDGQLAPLKNCDPVGPFALTHDPSGAEMCVDANSSLVPLANCEAIAAAIKPSWTETEAETVASTAETPTSTGAVVTRFAGVWSFVRLPALP